MDLMTRRALLFARGPLKLWHSHVLETAEPRTPTRTPRFDAGIGGPGVATRGPLPRQEMQSCCDPGGKTRAPMKTVHARVFSCAALLVSAFQFRCSLTFNSCRSFRAASRVPRSSAMLVMARTGYSSSNGREPYGMQPGSASPTLFLDIGSKLVSGGEQGLLGLAFHPLYANNGRFFVFYTQAATAPS